MGNGLKKSVRYKAETCKHSTMSSIDQQSAAEPIGPNVRAFADTLSTCLDTFKGHGFQEKCSDGLLPMAWLTSKTDGSRGLTFPVPSCNGDYGHYPVIVDEDGVDYGSGRMLFKGRHPSDIAALFFGFIITNTPFHPPPCPCCEAEKKDENAPTDSESGDESDDKSHEEARKRSIQHSIWSIENTNFDDPLPEDLMAGAKGIVRDSFVNKVVVTFPEEFPEKSQRLVGYNSRGLRLHTWGDLWELCDGIIRTSGDSDHCFIEDITREGDYLMIGCGS